MVDVPTVDDVVPDATFGRTTVDTQTNAISTIDLADWRAGGRAAADAAAEVDRGLQRAGFLLVRGHGLPQRLIPDLRTAARRFFALPTDVKARYSTKVAGRGWQAQGVEANGYSEGTETPPDLKEGFCVGARTLTGDPEIDAAWFPKNVFPDEVAEMRGLIDEYTALMKQLADELLRLCAAALDQPLETLASKTERSTWSFNLNHYPPMSVLGTPEPGQFRIGPHTDFGMVTILDREPGHGGLQVFTEQGGWADAPFDPAALTVNIGDLLAYWSGDRWLSGRHRVLPPQPSAPDEDLLTLVYFYHLDHDAVVTPLAPPIGKSTSREPVLSGVHLEAKLDAISVG